MYIGNAALQTMTGFVPGAHSASAKLVAAPGPRSLISAESYALAASDSISNRPR